MASIRQLKSRIRSVKSTKQITKAMELVAASKMRRAQDAEKATTPYSVAANELLNFFAMQGVTEEHPLFAKREVRRRLLIVIAADRGLAGAYNSNVFKAHLRELTADKKAEIGNHTITVGRRASQFVSRLKHTNHIGVYDGLPDQPDGHEIRAILETATTRFIDGEVDAVDLVYTEFVSSMNQRAVVKRILPAGYEQTEVTEVVQGAKYEPSAKEVLDGVAKRFVEAQIFQAFLDARASEYSMRMIAMKSATDNASEIASDLTLEMNKARQSAITQELAEISGGVEAMKE